MDHNQTKTTTPAGPRLRLVGVRPGPSDRPGNASPQTPRQRVAQENHAASRTAQSLPESDLRMVFAVNVASSLEGGRAALLPPDRRRSLVRAAASLGLKPFDANVVIAMVQNAAREGEDVRVVAGVLPLMRRRGDIGTPLKSAEQPKVVPATARAAIDRPRENPAPKRSSDASDAEKLRLQRMMLIALLIAAFMFAGLRILLSTP